MICNNTKTAMNKEKDMLDNKTVISVSLAIIGALITLNAFFALKFYEQGQNTANAVAAIQTDVAVIKTTITHQIKEQERLEQRIDKYHAVFAPVLPAPPQMPHNNNLPFSSPPVAIITKPIKRSFLL